MASHSPMPPNLWRYGFAAAPLAFVALPIYINLPHWYAHTFGVALQTLGLVLLVTRVLDALCDPLIGRLLDKLFAHPEPRWLVSTLGAAALAMCLGFYGLWSPLVTTGFGLWAHLSVCLVLTYIGYSTGVLALQIWGARFGGDMGFRARLSSVREGFTLLGIVLAAALPSVLAMPVMGFVLILLLGVALVLVWQEAKRSPVAAPERNDQSSVSVFASRAFVWLLLLYVLNALASSWTATVMPFYVDAVLGQKDKLGLYLLLYFASAAISLPLWLRLMRGAASAKGYLRLWLAAGLMTLLAFAGVLGIQTIASASAMSPAIWFVLICIATGISGAADLIFASSILTGVVMAEGHGQSAEGRYMGWWVMAQKLSLALAAALALYALGAVTATEPSMAAAAAHGAAHGTAHGTEHASAVTHVYVLAPLALKLVALFVLYRAMKGHVLQKAIDCTQ